MQCQQETEKGRQVEKQAVVENAKKHNSINAIQGASLIVWGKEQERKGFHKGSHTGHSTVRDLCCELDLLFWGNFCLLSFTWGMRGIFYFCCSSAMPCSAPAERAKAFPPTTPAHPF